MRKIKYLNFHATVFNNGLVRLLERYKVLMYAWEFTLGVVETTMVNERVK